MIAHVPTIILTLQSRAHSVLEECEPFQGPLRIEQLWMYKYPHHGSTVATTILIVS